MTIDDIPREHLIEMLKGTVWYSGERGEFGDKQGFSLDVSEETAVRDVVYRNETLYKTPDEAIIAHWQRHFGKH